MAEDTDDEDKVIDASPRRRQEARERGQVALSTELVVAGLLAGWLAMLSFAGGPLAATLAGGITRTSENLASFARVELTAQEAATQFMLVVMPAGKMGEPTQAEALDFAADIPPVESPVESPSAS